MNIRFALGAGYAARLELHEQVTIESEDGQDIWVNSRKAPAIGDVVEVYASDGQTRGRARVVEMHPKLVGNIVGVRVRLRRLAP